MTENDKVSLCSTAAVARRDTLNALKEVLLSIKRSGPASRHSQPSARAAVPMVTAYVSQ